MGAQKGKRKPGPKSRITEWEKPENIVLLQGWKRAGLTDEDVAHNMGIGLRTLYEWKAKSPQIAHTIKRSKQYSNYVVESALFQKALNGNVTAMIFYLKNNYREKYSDSQKSAEEIRAISAQARKTEAEALMAEYKAKLLADPSSIEDKVIIIDDFTGGEDNQEIKNKSDD